MSRLLRFRPLLALGLCLGLTVVFRAFVISYVVEPVALSLWLAWRVLLSVDQSVYWTLIVLLCVAWLISLLPYGNAETSIQDDREPPRPDVGVQRWQSLLQDAARTADGEDALRTRLRNLLASVVGVVEHPDAAGLEKSLKSKRVSLPPEAHLYLFPGPATTKPLSAKSLGFLLSRLRRWLRSLAGKPAVPDSAAIEELLRWMESRMEMKHDQ